MTPCDGDERSAAAAVGVLEGTEGRVVNHLNATPGQIITAEMREAVRHQIVEAGLRTSREIATAVDLRHALVVRILEHWVTVGALQVVFMAEESVILTIVDDSLSERFQDLAVPL